MFKKILAPLLGFARYATAGRFRALAVLLVVFVAVNTLVRLGLVVFNGDPTVFLPWYLSPILLIGALYDAAAATWLLAPLALLLGLLRSRSAKAVRWVFGALMVPLSFMLVFTAASEFTFWNEFASRLNFIAVDYLIYTNEVIGNLRESYNMPLLLSLVTLAAALLWWGMMRALRGALSAPPIGWRQTFGVLAIWLAVPALAYVAIDARYKEFSSNPQFNDLAGNGYFEFSHAFWDNEIDYDRFYKTMPRDLAVRELAAALNGRRTIVRQTQQPNDREVMAQGPRKELNVVLVSIESFSAEFMGTFGNTQNLTPNLDRLAGEGLLFSHLYATGTRTVRGLEALTLSVPPTPGHSIVKRPNNDGLFTIGEVFKENGYESLYIYGGYSYFDNMRAFFSGNGYTVVDRVSLRPEEIHFENIWGVADEDLFTLALRELDARHAAGKKFFAHVMTTSNHRPFTYPEGRIDIPSHSGREGGVKYTDWAIGDFVKRAQTKPWFKNTMFVFVADHTHKGRGKQELPINNYHIPCIVYAPAHLTPNRIDTIASQIDVAPTLLGLLNFSYRSKFFGHDILREGQDHPRALLANYQTVGYYEDGRIVELKPNARYRVVDAATGHAAPNDELSRHLLDKAISYYQLASQAFSPKQLREHKR